MYKKCNKCLLVLPIDNFSKKKQNSDGLQQKCKKCCKKYYEENKNRLKVMMDTYRKNNKEYFEKYRNNNKEYFEKYRNDNKEYLKINKQIYYQTNIHYIKKSVKEYDNKNKENKKKYNKLYKINNKEKIKLINNRYRKNRRLTDKNFKLTTNIRSLIVNSIHKNGYKKNSKTELILGCTFDEFKHHLESQFESWMNWGNYGNPKDGIFELNKTWDIDHIIPVSSAKTEDEIIKLNYYTNLQPLCSKVNRVIKRDTLS